MSQPQTRRDRRRANVATVKAKRAQRQAELARLAAERAEEVAEEQAPRQQRVAVVAADGSIVREALAEPDHKRGGYRRSDPLQRMHAHNPSLVTRQHLRAAERLSKDYELGVLGGTKPGGNLRARVDGETPPDMAEARLLAIGRYRAACDAMGPSLRIPVQQLVLHRWTLGRIARLLGVAECSVSGYLVAALDRLADWYWPDRPVRSDAAGDDDVCVDPAVADIPQEQIGRFRRKAA